MGGNPALTIKYLPTGALEWIKEGTTTLLASFGYDDLGRRTALTRGNGVATSYSYDPASRLSSLGLDLTDAANDQALGFTYNQAGQIATRSASNDAYAWTQHYNVNRGYGANALNQYCAIGSAACPPGTPPIAPTYDAKVLVAGAKALGLGSVFRGTGKFFYGGGGGGKVKAKAKADAKESRPERVQRPTSCQAAFLKDQLASRGLPTGQIDDMKFVSGLDSNANALTRGVFNGGASAVT